MRAIYFWTFFVDYFFNYFPGIFGQIHVCIQKTKNGFF